MSWKITKGGQDCCQCEKGFEELETYYSTIRIEGSEILRFDYCESCFGTVETRDDVYWRTKNTDIKPEKKQVNFEILRDLFFEMLEVKEKAFIDLCYLIALILVRKKYLKLKDFISDGGKDYMTVRQKKDTPLVYVEVPLLDDQDISRLKDKLSGLLDTDLDSAFDIGELREKLEEDPEVKNSEAEESEAEEPEAEQPESESEIVNPMESRPSNSRVDHQT